MLCPDGNDTRLVFMPLLFRLKGFEKSIITVGLTGISFAPSHGRVLMMLVWLTCAIAGGDVFFPQLPTLISARTITIALHIFNIPYLMVSS